MPLYSYQCNTCRHEFQQLVYPGDVAACPSCAGTDLEQMLSLIARPARGGPAEVAACGNASPACGGCSGAAGAFG
ncbi:MAG: zinc ribbon domain-containing protein [Xanthobacteraceae bacterium]|nr:MAG: zinc ribbon domain-containing protein [Xanthobacteraceae bacterium]